MTTSSAIRNPPSGLSYEAFLEWAEDGLHAEWVDGEIVVMSPASRSHQRVARFLMAILMLYVEQRNLGEVFPAPFQMRLAKERSGREPDISFVARERLETVGETYIDGPADLVVEIISPESRVRDTVEKFSEYEKAGVKEYWLVDPENQRATFHALENGKFHESQARGGRYQSRCLPGMWIEVNWLWSIPTPSIPEVQRAWEN